MTLTFEELKALKPHPLCQRMNDLHPLTKTGRQDSGEANNLRLSIDAFGPRHRIVIDAETGDVLDGWNTLQTWLDLKKSRGESLEPIMPHVESRTFENDEAKQQFFLRVQLGRRNLSSGQRAQLAVSLFHAEGRTQNVRSLESVSKKLGVARTSIMRAERVRREGALALEQAVGRGTVSQRDASTLIAAKLSKGEQEELLAQGPEVVKARAAAIRAEQAAKPKAAALAAALAAERESGYGKRNVAAALDEARRRYEADHGHLPRPAPAEAVDALSGEMAVPVAPRDRGAPAVVSGAWPADPDVGQLNLALQRYFRSHLEVPERMAAVQNVEGLLDAAWRSIPTAAQEAFLQKHGGGRANGVPISMETLEKLWKVKRETPSRLVLDLCVSIEGDLNQYREANSEHRP